VQLTSTFRREGELTIEQRDGLLRVANACPIHKVLTGEMRMAIRLENGA
jgi:putative redox protein